MKIKIFFANVLFMFLICSDAYLMVHSKSNANKRRSGRNQSRIENRNAKKYKFDTPLVDGQRGSIYSLANHNIDCYNRDGPISGFHLFGKTGFISNSNAYEFNCLPISLPIKTLKGLNNSTDKVSISSSTDATKTLKNFNISCNNNGFITTIKLNKEGNHIFYTYTCVELVQQNCEDLTTQKKGAAWFGIGSDSVTSLDQHYVDSPQNKALVSFRLEVEGDKIYYKYRSCSIDVEGTKRLSIKTNETSVRNNGVKTNNNDNPLIEKNKVSRRRRYY
jgi:hypothetical protein